MWTFGDKETAEAVRLFQRARELDPSFAAAYAHEAYAKYLRVITGYAETPEKNLVAGLATAKKATALDDKDAVGYFALGRVLMMMGQHDASIAQLEHSIRLNPSFSQAHHGLGFALALAGRLEEAVEAQEMAIRLSPRDPLAWATTVVHSITSMLMHEHEEALVWAERTVRLPRMNSYYPHAVLGAALANLDRVDEARAAIEKAIEWKPDLTVSFVEKNMPTKQPGGLAPYLDGLRKAGLPE